MGLGRNSRKRRRRRRRMPSLTSEEGRRGFSARFDGMQTHALLKQYRGAASFIYRDEEKHSSLSAALLGERSAENAVVHISTQCFPLPLRMTNAGTRVSVLSSALSPSCPNLNIPVSRHLSLFCFSLHHRVFLCSFPVCFISCIESALVITPRGSIGLLTSLRCNFSLNREDPASVSRKQYCQNHKQRSH